MPKKNQTELILDGLDCANCALKIEKAVQKIEGVKAASLDFTTQKLHIEFEDVELKEAIIDQATHEALRIEPEIRVLSEAKDADEKEAFWTTETISLVLGALLFAIALIFDFDPAIETGLFGISFLMVGSDIMIKAGRDILKGQWFDESFLMSLATIGAFAIGQYPEAVAVMLFYKVGERFQDGAVDHSRRSIKALLDIRPDYANAFRNDGFMKVSPQSVKIGEIILVKPGEKVPLDGIVTEGSSFLDTASITGESLPRAVGPQDLIYSGSINQSGLLKIKVTKVFEESTVSKILDLVQNAASKKASTEQFITKFARIYTPVVVGIAVLMAVLPPLLISGATFDQWIYRALIFLVVSCPCALVISIPLGYFGGIGGASKQGILMKGSNYLEALNNIETIVFDKTGTLTQGQFSVTSIQSFSNFTQDEILKAAALAESNSNHPIALSIQKAYGKVDPDEVKDVKELPGLGLLALTDKTRILAGNDKLMRQYGFEPLPQNGTGSSIHIAIGESYAGVVIVEDQLKNDAKATIDGLKALGISRIVMLTGDAKAVGEKMANALGITEVASELLPEDKVKQVEKLTLEKKTKGKLVFVGDGINDAPVLMRADVGIAMGALGSDAAIEAADIVLMTDEPKKILSAIRLARFTQRVVWQNIALALGVKTLVLILGAFGIASMWEAVFADVGVALLAVFNALRLLNPEN